MGYLKDLLSKFLLPHAFSVFNLSKIYYICIFVNDGIQYKWTSKSSGKPHFLFISFICNIFGPPRCFAVNTSSFQPTEPKNDTIILFGKVPCSQWISMCVNIRIFAISTFIRCTPFFVITNNMRLFSQVRHSYG